LNGVFVLRVFDFVKARCDTLQKCREDLPERFRDFLHSLLNVHLTLAVELIDHVLKLLFVGLDRGPLAVELIEHGQIFLCSLLDTRIEPFLQVLNLHIHLVDLFLQS